MLRYLVLAGALSGVLCACAAQPTPYQPRDGAYGYTETQLDGQTWRVEFAGNADTPRETVENYLLYRSAEVMLFGGYERFIILEKEVERTRDIRTYGPYPYGVYPYPGDWGPGAGWHPHHSHFRRHYAYGVPSTFALDYYRAIATIRTFTGNRPPAGLQVYVAREVIAQLGRSVVLPN